MKKCEKCMEKWEKYMFKNRNVTLIRERQKWKCDTYLETEGVSYKILLYWSRYVFS